MMSAPFIVRTCLGRILCFLLGSVFFASAHACLFARDAQPKDWLEWATVLLAADVVGIEQDKQKMLDIVSLRVVETFKGPAAAETATLQMPSRLWEACRLARPVIGARVLAALNPNSDALLVPLSADYAERLRALRPASAPAPTSK
jgi:hypothetical protein